MLLNATYIKDDNFILKVSSVSSKKKKHIKWSSLSNRLLLKWCILHRLSSGRARQKVQWPMDLCDNSSIVNILKGNFFLLNGSTDPPPPPPYFQRCSMYKSMWCTVFTYNWGFNRMNILILHSMHVLFALWRKKGF